MIYALIVEQRVINVVHADESFILELISNEEIDDAILIAEGESQPNPGDKYIDGEFVVCPAAVATLIRTYQCTSCSVVVENAAEIRQHTTENPGHYFARVFY